MGKRLKVEYPHFPDLRPAFLTNEQMQALAWDVRTQIGCAESGCLKIPLNLVLTIEGATVNGLYVKFRWEIHESVHEKEVPVLGVCDYDYEEMPGVALLLANSGIVNGWEAMLRSILAHELCHGLCEVPAWIIAHRNRPLPGILDVAVPNQTRAVTTDRAHLCKARRTTAEDFSEFRANEFMGAFLVPKRLLLEPLRHHARRLDIPLIEQSRPPTLSLAASATEFRVYTRHGEPSRLRLPWLFRALAQEFGVTPRFIQVRLMRYGLLDDERPRGTRNQQPRRYL
jgi:hypothetical protein